VVVTAVAAMGGTGRATGSDWLIVSAPGPGGILTSVSCASMVKRTNGARWVGGGVSLIGVSRSPTLSTLGGLVGQEGKFHLGFLCKHDGPRGTGRNMLGLDGNNHGTGLLGFPRISARVKVPGSENWSRFVIEDCLLDIWE